jgi:hypothetical protein
VSHAQIQKSAFIGAVGPDKLGLTFGLELASKVKNKMAFFIRPSYSPSLFRNDIVTVKYLDLPVGIKYIIANENSYSIDFNIGPYIGFGISGKYPTAPFTQSKMTFGKGANAQMDGLDYGLFLNTQMALGNTFGFGISTQFELKEHDLSKLGTAATTAKEKARKQSQVTLFYNLGKRVKK